VTKAPIVFIGVGEHLEDLETFDPPRFISRLLGMGDLQTLLEKAQEVVDEDEMKDSASKMMTGKFTLLDMQEQLEMVGKMGALDKMLDLLPGMGPQKMAVKDIPGMDIGATEERLEKFKIIMKSMTQQELEDPKLLKSSRIKRIARGSGCDQKDVRALLKQYNQFKKMMKGMMGNRKMRKQLMKQMSIQDQ